MIYLTYDEYINMGGKLEMTAFDRSIGTVCLMIDNRSFSRLREFAEIPCAVKIACRELVEYIAENTVSKTVQSRSQSAGGVSESESYAVKSAEDYANDIDNIIAMLSEVKTKNGISILYRGAMS